MTCRALLGLLAGLVLPAPAFALRHVIVGNEPLGGYNPELLTLLNVEERVYLEDGPLGGTVTVYFHGGPRAVNAALRRFAALPAKAREIHLRPAPAPPLEWDKKPIPYNWVLYVPGDETGRRERGVKEKAKLTVYIPEPLPPAPAAPAAARRWIADLGSEDFKTRERAAKELADLGPSVAALLREALQRPASAEARDRMEKLLAGMSTTLRLDVLELPAGVPVVSIDDLLAKARKGLADNDPIRRGHAASALVEPGLTAEEVLPDLEKLLRTETGPDLNPLYGAMWAANRLGAGARPLVPLLRAAADRADKDFATICRQVIDGIEKSKAEPVPEAEARKRAVIRKEIKEFVAGRAPDKKDTPRSSPPGESPPDRLIGYTEFRTDLPGGRYVNQATMRAAVVQADGTGRRVLAEELTREKNSWTQFRGWSPDGKTAVFSRSWMSDENGKWEEEHKDFRYAKGGFTGDGYLFDLAAGKATNVTAVERVSHANEYLQFWPPGDETKLSFSALIDGAWRPYVMDRDGKNKRELVRKTGNLVHGMSISPDDKRGAYEDPAYRLFIADADGSNARQVKTGHPFHLMPTWSPDGAWLLFVAGTHYDCHPHVVKADETGLKMLASRNGYRGVIDYLDVPDFHDGSSDLPVWAPDSKAVFYTAKVGGNVELFRIPLDGQPERLTDTPAGSMHYHPAPSRDGKWLLYGSKRGGVRQLYVMRLTDKKEYRLTDLKKGHAAMWAHWQPAAR